jgi:hypothetical protein
LAGITPGPAHAVTDDRVYFTSAEFSGDEVDFTRAEFSGDEVDFSDYTPSQRC